MKTIAIVQARLGSVRLPSKVLSEVSNSPLIELLLSRLSKAVLLDDIVVAIPSTEASQPLREVILKLGFSCFEGAENDVLDRYYQSAAKFNADNIVLFFRPPPETKTSFGFTINAFRLNRTDSTHAAVAVAIAS